MRLKWKDLGKYFSHGIVFTMLFFISVAVWNLLLLVFVGFSFILALVIGSILLLLTIGFLNGIITAFLWFEVTDGFSKLLAHGLALFLTLFALDSILITLPTLAFPGLATTTATFVVGTIANGLVAKRIAVYWRQEDGVGTSNSIEEEGHAFKKLEIGLSEELGKDRLAIFVDDNALRDQLRLATP